MLLQISIHAPPRGATTRRECRPCARLFQFTPLREGRRASCSRVTMMFLFQFTPLREGRPHVDVALKLANHFNSRPSARGDISGLLHSDGRNISIHAPPRGATRLRRSRICPLAFQFTPLREGRLDSRERCDCGGISIHAPPRGATIVTAAIIAA